MLNLDVTCNMKGLPKERPQGHRRLECTTLIAIDFMAENGVSTLQEIPSIEFPVAQVAAAVQKPGGLGL